MTWRDEAKDKRVVVLVLVFLCIFSHPEGCLKPLRLIVSTGIVVDVNEDRPEEYSLQTTSDQLLNFIRSERSVTVERRM